VLPYYLVNPANKMSLLQSSTRTRTGWRRLIGSPKLQIIFHKRATKHSSFLWKMTYKDKGSYESSPPCMWHRTATHCQKLEHTATHCNTLQHTATHCNTLQHIATHCNTLPKTGTCCNTRQNTATHLGKLQEENAVEHSDACVTTHCNTLQRTATHCNTLQHTLASRKKKLQSNTLTRVWHGADSAPRVPAMWPVGASIYVNDSVAV